ncbi:unnamed protein product [Chironomus riparius]|uniref:G-protein coupled receptors family 1 profile domain-containing protein n=1 Tax=Chironomus riparius TaxID=315576 RepID=A0A9P0N7G7_9DIPT|nr:unnamed protein product [Chironomus riparius]
MPAVLSTSTGGTTSIYLSSTWPWSLHMSLLSSSMQRNMTFWNDLIATFAQLILLTSSTVVFTSNIGTALDVGLNFLSTSTTSSYSQPYSTYQSLRTHGNGIDAYKQQQNTINQSSRQKSNGNNFVISDRLNDNQNNITNNNYYPNSDSNQTVPNGVIDIISGKMFNLTSAVAKSVTPVSSTLNETILIGTSHYGNLTTTSSSTSALNNLVDCNDFTEQKLLNIVICSISDVNSNIINGTNAENSTFNDTFKNISDDLIRFYNTNNSFFNGTEVSGNNDTGIKATEFETTIYFIQVITTAVVLGIIILATVIGNVFVIAAILLEKNLQSVANYLILSLAVADLLVACLVMPLSAVYEISREWKLGPELCDMWTSSDVLCCTASILHLVAIALDRYWAVTDIDYAHQRTAKRIGIMIVILWILSFLVSIAPMFGWKDPEWDKRLENYECLVSQDVGYQIFATASSFYVPLLAILFLYWRIFLVARKRIRRRQQVTYGQQQEQQKKKQMPSTPTPAPGGCVAQAVGSGSGAMVAAVVAVIGRPLPTISEATTTTTTTAFTNVSSTNTSPEKGSYANGLDDRIEMDPPTSDVSVAYPSNVSCPPHPFPNTWKKQQQQLQCKRNNPVPSLISQAQQQQLANKQKPTSILAKQKKTPNANDTSSKRERKAAKTLAIITGAFVVCWMPFFVIAVLLPICGEQCEVSPVIISLFLWLGYFNSTLNPILYTIFNQDFRNAFKRLLCGRRNSVRRRNRRMGGANSNGR